MPPSSGVMPCTFARLPLRSLMTSPVFDSGTRIFIDTIGSRSTGFALSAPCLRACEPAILNAISDESTGWSLPSNSVTDVDHREVRQRALVQRLLHTLLDGGDVVARHGAADHLVDEFEPATLVRLDLDVDARVLAVAAGLLLVDVLGVHARCHGLAVRHLRRVQVDVHAELALHPLRR